MDRCDLWSRGAITIHRRPSTILVGNNLALELMTLVAEHALEKEGVVA